MTKELSIKTVDKIERPVRVLQFGEGNFLRAFVDWMIDLSNEAGVTDIGVAICKPREGVGALEKLSQQDNMYNVYLEGIENGQTKKDIRLVRSIMDSFNPYTDYAKYEEYITSPSVRFVISNTTEAGIRYEEGDDLTAMPPKSFPAKITALLHKRFEHFDGDHSKGLIIICCELIENNGTTLRDYVLRHAKYNNLSDEFIAWVENSCHFCDTLVDRIVSGFPYDTIDEIKEEIGYNDNLVVKGELYHIWAIGGSGYKTLQNELPLDKAGLNVLFLPSIKKFRDKKVRILNGAHTAMVTIALQMGCESVMDAFNIPSIELFIKNLVAKEILPVIDEPREELDRFAEGILERFYNPYIKHLLVAISLNSLSKWEARNYPTLKDNWDKYGKIAKHECFSFASLLTLYSGKSGFEPNDTPEFIEFIRSAWSENDVETRVTKIIKEGGIFVEDFSEVPDFISNVAAYVTDIEELGMSEALNKFLA